MSWERARSDDQKAVRIQAIQDAAGDLFLNREYHSISLGLIAQRAGFTRPNLYRYYKTKEEIFLSILEKDLDRWVGELESDSKFQPEPASKPASKERSESHGHRQEIAEFAAWWVRHFAAQPRLPRLLPLMAFSLDDNAGEELLKAFKLGLAEISRRISGIVLNRLPWYPPDQLADFPLLQLALVTGLMPMATRGEVHNRVLEDPRLRGFAIDFEHHYQKLLSQFLGGVENMETNQKESTQ